VQETGKSFQEIFLIKKYSTLIQYLDRLNEVTTGYVLFKKRPEYPASYRKIFIN
jgi:hypothetical protein